MIAYFLTKQTVRGMILSYNEIFTVVLVFILVMLFYVIRTLNTLIKRHNIEKLPQRVKVLEEELDEYILRSHKRLDVFRHVIDGFDQVIQNVKKIIQEEDPPPRVRRMTKSEAKDFIENHGQEEAEVVRIDQTFHNNK